MKAMVARSYGGPEVMGMEEVEAPAAGPGQVLVAVKAAGVNPVDTYILGGSYSIKPVLPYIPGMDGAGVVEAAGSGVAGFAPGDRVYFTRSASGSYAEKTLCPAHFVYHLPGGISFSQGAAIGIPYGAAHRALFQRARAVAGEWVLVHGASGGVGIAATQLARAAGLHVIGTAGTEAGRRLALEQGAHHVVDHHDQGHVQEVLSLTGGRGVDVILEMLANRNLGTDPLMLAPRGRVVLVGSRGSVEINPRDIMARDAVILGMVVLNATAEELAGIYYAVNAGLEAGTLRPVVALELPLAEASRAHQLIMGSPAGGKIVLLP